MPVLEEISKGLFGNIRLENTLLIACQHILMPQYIMFQSFFDKGLLPSSTFLLGKCYSIDDKALNLFIKSGVNVHKASANFESHKSYDEQYQNYVKEFLTNISNNLNFSKYDKVILLDDGGFLLDFANKHLKSVKNVIGIEQTSSGFNRINNSNLRFPVFNVARSNAKLVYETPLIVNQFMKNLMYELNQLKRTPKKVLVIGKGSIGKEIVKRFRKDCEVYAFDILNEESDIGELSANIHKFDLIIGCSGKYSLPIQLYSKLKKNAILASVSSSDREFFASYLRFLAEQYKECHHNIKIRDVVLLNSGFPVTFTKHSIGSSARDMQLTMSLLFSAVCTSVTGNFSKGLVELNLNIQNLIINKFQEQIGGQK